MSSGPSRGILVRSARPDDVAAMHAMVVELAVYEKEPADRVELGETELAAALFGERPLAEARVAEVDGVLAGQAIFYETFSTWEGAGIWLEDLFVRPDFRGSGAGAALFSHLAALTVERGFARLEWCALDWNTPALDFYQRWGAVRGDEWIMHRLSADALLEAANVTARGGG